VKPKVAICLNLKNKILKSYFNRMKLLKADQQSTETNSLH